MARLDLYQTVQGDTWDLISFKLFNNEFYGNQLIEANLQYVNVQKFDQGFILRIPTVVFPNSVSSVVWGTTRRVS